MPKFGDVKWKFQTEIDRKLKHNDINQILNRIISLVFFFFLKQFDEIVVGYYYFFFLGII